MTISIDHLPLRQRKKITAMRRIQEVAVALALEHGYTNVTVERIAEASDVSPNSVYRYFETKEGIFLWEEGVDDDFLAGLGESDLTGPVSNVFKRVFAERVGDRFDGDPQTVEWMQLIWHEPELKEAMLSAFVRFEDALFDLLEEANPDEQRLANKVRAGAVIAAFSAATELWVEANGKRDFGPLLDEALSVIEAGI